MQIKPRSCLFFLMLRGNHAHIHNEITGYLCANLEHLHCLVLYIIGKLRVWLSLNTALLTSLWYWTSCMKVAQNVILGGVGFCVKLSTYLCWNGHHLLKVSQMNTMLHAIVYSCNLQLHNITQLLSYIPWDLILDVDDSPLIPGSPFMRSHVGYLLWSLWQTLINP